MVKLAESILDCPDIKGVWNVNGTSGNDTVGDVTLSQSDTGPYIHFICPEGAHVIGPSRITCLQGGVWDDTTRPTCSTSSLFGIYQSDIILIAVLAASGALVIMGITIVLTHLLCFKDKNKTSSLSQEGLDRCSESNPSSSPYYIDDKFINTISTPSSVTMNGHPLTSGGYHNNHHHTDPSNFQTMTVDRAPVVLSYIPQNERTFSLPRFFVQQSRTCYPNYPALSDSQPVHNVEGYLQPEMSTHGRVVSHPGRQEHVFTNHAFTNDTSQELSERWQDSTIDDVMDSFSDEASGDYYENLD